MTDQSVIIIMRRLVFLILPAAAALFAPLGCTVGPTYRSPKSNIESTFGDVASVPSTQPTSQPTALLASPMTTARWWDALHDAQLSALMDRVAQSNLDVKVAQARVVQARAELAYASGTRYPTADVNAGYSHQRLSKTAAPYNAFDIPGFPWEFNQYQAGFDASWELDLFGGTRRGVEAAQAQAAASVFDRQDVLLSAMAELARNYVDLRGYQQRERIAQSNLKNQRETLELTQDRRKQGLVTELDVARAQSQVSRTEAQLPTLRQHQAEAIHRIAVLLGEQPEALTSELSKPAAVPVPPPQIAIGVPGELLRRRPDIRRAERDLAAATARTGQATANLYPRFSLTGNFTMLSADTKDLFDWNSRSFGFGPTVSWPIFDANRLRSLVDVRSAQQQAAEAQYEKTVLGALEEVHNAIVAFASEQQRRLALVHAVDADRTAAEVARGQYKQGVIDFLGVLDAERSLHDSEDELADSERLVTTSLVALYKALAGGWNPTPTQSLAHATTQ
jgi:NodT family efflux transporter outer membrane factor (OMF) lipoprotein